MSKKQKAENATIKKAMSVLEREQKVLEGVRDRLRNTYQEIEDLKDAGEDACDLLGEAIQRLSELV